MIPTGLEPPAGARNKGKAKGSYEVDTHWSQESSQEISDINNNKKVGTFSISLKIDPYLRKHELF